MEPRLDVGLPAAYLVGSGEGPVTDEPTPGDDATEEAADAAALLRAVLEIGKALRPLTAEGRRRVLRKLLAELHTSPPQTQRER